MAFSAASSLSRLSKAAGLTTVIKSPSDAKLLFLQRFVRMFGYGATFLILVHFLSSLENSDERIGLFMTMTMLGDVLISFILTLITDRIGRRNVLAAGAVLMAMSGIVFALTSIYWMLLLASVIGVISPSGNEIGPFKAVEESVLAQLVERNDYSDVFAWYAMSGTAGAAIGTITSGWLVQRLQNHPSWTMVKAYRVVFGIYAGLGVLKLVLTSMLSRDVELEQNESIEYQAIELSASDEFPDGLHDLQSSPAEEPATTNQDAPVKMTPRPRSSILSRLLALLPQISRQSLTILFRLILLFALDSFASGLASPSWLTYFFSTYHSISASALGSLFFTTNVLATISNFCALPLARHLGPLKTMTFTHLPSAIFLGLVPIPPATTIGTWIAMVFLSLRACTQSMDQAPRQAFLAAVMRPEERTAILGIVNVTKTIAQAGGLGISGVLAAKALWVVMIGGAGAMKATYDLLILWTFLGIKDR